MCLVIDRYLGFFLLSQDARGLVTTATVRYGTETVSFSGPKIWDILPNEIKNSETLHKFKAKIKSWIPADCPCRLCKRYVARVGFI